MKNIFTIFVLLIGITISAQDAYKPGMEKAFDLWKENKTTEATAMFERIAQVEKENWLPSYYAANVLITSSFQTKDKVLVNEMLEKAKTHISNAHKISPDNSEITTMEGLLYTGYVAMDPGTYGMTYSGQIMGLHQKAVTQDKNNPRAHANLIGYEIGSARFFKQDLSQFCKRLQEVIPMFENQKQDIPFLPNYGIERAKASMEECGC
jgi:hypothetical protein